MKLWLPSLLLALTACQTSGGAEESTLAVDAEAAGQLEKAIDHYGNAERFYEQWRDGEAQIERLKKAIAERAGAGAGEGKS